ncbi:MAG: fused MFS/spermidine synthase [Myxococcales bacterium]|nr:fused MFS/spermidine synthase [Myxococcales bacterium]
MGARLRALLYFCFFLTGACGLVYEVVWSRYLAILLGNTAHAHTIVLATFMGGLAIGGFAFGRLADRLRKPIRVYGWLEAAIGLYAFFFDAIFRLYFDWFVPLGRLTYGREMLSTLWQFGLAILCILPAAIWMGGTLPILTRAITARESELRGNVGALYAINSAGAVLGTLLAGFYLVFHLGLPASMMLVGALNTLLGLAMALVGRSVPREVNAVEPPAVETGAPDEAVYSRAERTAALALAGFSGFATMALEIAWIRYFYLVLGSSTYAFTLMLAAFITGIAAGSAWLRSARAGRIPLVPLLAGALLATAAFLALSLQFYDRVPFFLWRLRLLFRPIEGNFPYYQGAIYAACFLCMFLPTIAAGVVFPATIRLAAQRRVLGGRVGAVYAINTLGTLAGAATTGLLLFQTLGLFNIFRVLFLSYAIAAVLLTAGLRRRARGFALAAVLLIALHLAVYRPIDPRVVGLGLYRRNLPPTTTFGQLRAEALHGKLLYLGEGPHAYVTVVENDESPVIDAPMRSLVINGKPDAGTGSDMYTQTLLGHLPLLFLDEPRDVFVVGLGSGVTVGAALTHGVRVDVAEISREVIAAEKWFAPYNHEALKNPRVSLYAEDAATALRFLGRQYDAVISEPSNPWQSGNASLFSLEFYQLVKQSLRPDGLLVQWMHTYNANDAAVEMVVDTLLRSFRRVSIFESLPGDYLFLASDAPLPFSPERFREKFNRPEVRADLARIHADNPAVILSMQCKQPLQARLEFDGQTVHSEYLPRLEHLAALPLFTQQKSSLLNRLDDRQFDSPGLLWAAYTRRYPIESDDIEKLFLFYRGQGPQGLKGDRGQALARLIRPRFKEAGGMLATFYLDLLRREPLTFQVLENPLTERERTDPGYLQVRFQYDLQYFDSTYWSWAPPDAGELIRLADSFAEVTGGKMEMHRSLVETFCRLGPYAACQSETDRLLRNTAPERDFLETVYRNRIQAALRYGDWPGAEEYRRRWAAIADDSRSGSLERIRAEIRYRLNLEAYLARSGQ